jgi:cysteine desulfurase / selenocysteine lyase
MNPALIDKYRRETSGTQNVIHLNNAGASLMPDCVRDTLFAYLQSESAIGGYETFARYEQELNRFYELAAGLINVKSHEIAFAESATRAWQMAFYSLPFDKGDRILTSRTEYASNYISYLQLKNRTGVTVEPVPNDGHGRLSVDALAEMLDERVKLVSVTHVPTNSGLINPVEEIGRLLKNHPAVFLIDACQSVGQMPVDVDRIGCDILSATGRKYLRGPRGSGFLYIREELLQNTEPVMLDLHSADWTSPDRYEMRPDARRFENWEINFAGKLGLAEAIRYALEQDAVACWNRIQELAGLLRDRLDNVDGISVKDPGLEKCGIVSFDSRRKPVDKIRDELRNRNINISVTGGNSTLLDSQDRNLDRLGRASVHYYNTESEIDRFIAELKRN